MPALDQEVRRGTNSTDTTCSSQVVYYVVSILLPLVIVGAGIAGFLICTRRHLHTSSVAKELEPFQQEQQENTIRFPVTEVGFAETEEETASN